MILYLVRKTNTEVSESLHWLYNTVSEALSSFFSWQKKQQNKTLQVQKLPKQRESQKYKPGLK